MLLYEIIKLKGDCDYGKKGDTILKPTDETFKDRVEFIKHVKQLKDTEQVLFAEKTWILLPEKYVPVKFEIKQQLVMKI